MSVKINVKPDVEALNKALQQMMTGFSSYYTKALFKLRLFKPIDEAIASLEVSVCVSVFTFFSHLTLSFFFCCWLVSQGAERCRA
jgi:hypothetical protein